MIAKFVVITVFILIIGSLGSALIHLMSGRGGGQRTARALTWRIGLSIALFLGLVVASQLGFIQPHGIRGGLAAPADTTR